MLEASSVFNENFYLTAYPDLAEAKNKGLLNSGYDHFMQFGKFEGRSPSAYFDQSLYLMQNPDVAQALSAGTISNAFDHLVQYGQKENRAASLVFNNSYYLAQNPDVAAAVERDELTGIEHFAKFGIDEGRASSEAFDVRYYLEHNPDLKAAGLNNRQAVEHFATYGLREGRPSSEMFDVRYYLNRYPDLQAAGLIKQQALEHFLVYGIKEGRSGSLAPQPLIGIIDTGFSGNNPDINYSRIALGKDRVDGDDNPLLSADEGNEHGTHILGIIGATKNNGVGIDGINDEAPLWVGRAIGSGQWAESLREFVDAAKQSEQPNAIANLSLDLTQIDLDGNITTRYELTPREREALEYARQNGVLVVVPAGNDGDVMSALGQASQEFDNIITVGAADNQNRADYSSYGDGLDIVTEGGTILDPVQSLVGDDVGTMAGTSVAAAKVTGAASLVWKANPQLNYQQVIEILKSTATDINTAGWDEQTGNGLLNQEKAVETAKITTPVDYTPEPIPLIDTWDGEGEFIPQERPAADKFKDKYYEWVSYTVKPGDTLSEIAIRTMGEGSKAYYEFIAEHNNIANPDLIKVGQKIEIPKQVSAPSSKPDTGDTSEEQVSAPSSKPDKGDTSEEQVSPPSSKPDTGNTSEDKNNKYEWETYIIREGDTLSEIAQKRTGNASDYKLIADKNNIANPDLIYPGDEILVPKAVSDSKPENDKPQQPSQSTNINGHTIGGNFYSVYQNNQNKLGKPTSNAIKTSDDVSYQLFEKGSIVSSEHGTFPLFGAIRQKFLNSGGLDGWLGAPTGGEKQLANAHIKQTFENGYIVWNGKNAVAYRTGSGKPSNSVSPPTVDIEFGSYKPTSKYVTPAFLDKVEDIGRQLDVAPEYLMAVMGFETGGSYSPKIKNAAGSGATGLIQFMPSTAKNLGTSTAALANMSAVQQLDYVEKYLSPYKGRLDSLEDTYMAVLWPKAVGKNNNYPLFSKGGSAYDPNKGLDTNDDGVVTKKEAAGKVRKYLPGSELFERASNNNSGGTNPGDDGNNSSGSLNNLKPYTVKSGDTLWKIAENQLGNGSRWVEIKEADGTTFTEAEAEKVQAGKTIYLPIKPSSIGSEVGESVGKIGAVIGGILGKIDKFELDYGRFNKTLDYMYGEMVNNAKSDEAKSIKENLDSLWFPKNAQAFNDFRKLVTDGAKWDHKPILVDKLDLWGADGKAGKPETPEGKDDDYYFPIRGDGQHEYYFDIWSNIHYGYVGRSVGFSRLVLQIGGAVNDAKKPENWDLVFGDNSDKASIAIGMDLWEKHQLNLKPQQLHESILAFAAQGKLNRINVTNGA